MYVHGVYMDALLGLAVPLQFKSVNHIIHQYVSDSGLRKISYDYICKVNENFPGHFFLSFSSLCSNTI